MIAQVKHKWLIVLVLLLTVGGCTHRPAEVLSKRKMQALLVDLHRTDGLISVIGYNYGHDYAVAAYYEYVLEKHGVTQAQFDSSLVWYTDHPLLFNRMYPKVLEQLKAEQEMYEQLSEDALSRKEAAYAKRRQNGDWRKWIDRHARPMDYSLWKDTVSTEILPPLGENPLFLQKK